MYSRQKYKTHKSRPLTCPRTPGGQGRQPTTDTPEVAKEKAHSELCVRHQGRRKQLLSIDKHRDQTGKDVQQVGVIEDISGDVITSEEILLRRWKQYSEELMNEAREKEM